MAGVCVADLGIVVADAPRDHLRTPTAAHQWRGRVVWLAGRSQPRLRQDLLIERAFARWMVASLSSATSCTAAACNSRAARPSRGFRDCEPHSCWNRLVRPLLGRRSLNRERRFGMSCAGCRAICAQFSSSIRAASASGHGGGKSRLTTVWPSSAQGRGDEPGPILPWLCRVRPWVCHQSRPDARQEQTVLLVETTRTPGGLLNDPGIRRSDQRARQAGIETAKTAGLSSGRVIPVIDGWEVSD